MARNSKPAAGKRAAPRKPEKPRHEKGDGGTLTAKQRAWVRAFAAGASAKGAAIAAGYSPHSARAYSYDLLKHPQIRAELEKVYALTRQSTAYTAADAFKEAGEVIAHALATGNANAHSRAVELRAKLHGLLIDRHQVDLDIGVDLAGALAEAKARVRPMCDPVRIIDAESVVIPKACAVGPPDNESVAPSQAVDFADFMNS